MQKMQMYAKRCNFFFAHTTKMGKNAPKKEKAGVLDRFAGGAKTG